MNSPSIPPKSTRCATGAEAIGIAVVVLLFLGFLGFMEFKNLLAGYMSGGYVKMSAIEGEWQAAGRPWRIVFRPDKTLGMNTVGSSARSHPRRIPAATVQDCQGRQTGAD